MMQIFIYKDRIYFVGKVKDLKDKLALYKNKFTTIKDLIKNNLH